MTPKRYTETTEILAMPTVRTLSLAALALVSGLSLLSPTGAQQHQKPSAGGEIQLYSLPADQAGNSAIPTKSAEPPAAPPAAQAESPAMSPEPPPTAAARSSPATDPEPTAPARPPRGPQVADDDAASSDWSPPGGSIKIEDYRGIRYLSGGIGEGERAELDSVSGQFNLRLLFAMQGSGNYLADIRVNILDSRGEVALSAESNGPWFFVQLPPGTYTIEVSIPDQLQRQTVRIEGSRQSQLNFYWR
jgi:hypothetical protein